MFAQLTKMSNSLGIFLPEIEKLTNTLLDWCHNVDKSFAMLHSDLASTKEEFSTRSLQIHNEFHRSVTDIHQTSDNNFFEKYSPRLQAIESRLEAFSEKLVQLQDQIFQKMTSVLEVQTNFTSVVNKVRANHDEMYHELKIQLAASEDQVKNLRTNVDAILLDITTLNNRTAEIQEGLKLRKTEHSAETDDLLRAQKESLDHFSSLNQKMGHFQVDFHEHLDLTQQALKSLEKRISSIENSEKDVLHNFQDKLQSIIKLVTDVDAKTRDQPRQAEIQTEIQKVVFGLRNKEKEQDDRLSELENAEKVRKEQKTTAEETDVPKEIHDLVKKVNVIFESVGTLRCDVNNLKLQTDHKAAPIPMATPSLIPEYLMQRRSSFEPTTCSLGYENCFLSRSGLCTDTFHLPRKSTYGGFHPVDPPRSAEHHGMASSNSKANFSTPEPYQFIVARNVASFEETPISPNAARNLSGPF